MARTNKPLGGKGGEEELGMLRCRPPCPLPVPAPATSRGQQQSQCHRCWHAGLTVPCHFMDEGWQKEVQPRQREPFTQPLRPSALPRNQG